MLKLYTSFFGSMSNSEHNWEGVIWLFTKKENLHFYLWYFLHLHFDDSFEARNDGLCDSNESIGLRIPLGRSMGWVARPSFSLRLSRFKICGFVMVNLSIGYIYVYILQASSLSTAFVAHKGRLGWVVSEERHKLSQEEKYQGGGSFAPYTTFLPPLSF